MESDYRIAAVWIALALVASLTAVRLIHEPTEGVPSSNGKYPPLEATAVIRVQLSPAEADRLDALFRSADDATFRARLQIVLMAHRGRPRQDIATDLGIHRRTVTRWLNAHAADGVDGLRPKKAKGTPGKIPASLADVVKQWVVDGPAEQGLDRANWTHEELAGHLLKTKGIRTSRSAVQRFCSGIGIRLYRPTYHHDRGDPVKQATAKEDLIGLGNGRRPAASSS